MKKYLKIFIGVLVFSMFLTNAKAFDTNSVNVLNKCGFRTTSEGAVGYPIQYSLSGNEGKILILTGGTCGDVWYSQYKEVSNSETYAFNDKYLDLIEVRNACRDESGTDNNKYKECDSRFETGAKLLFADVPMYDDTKWVVNDSNSLTFSNNAKSYLIWIKYTVDGTTYYNFTYSTPKTDVAISSIEVVSTQNSIAVGDKTQVHITYTPSNAERTYAKTTWTSSDPSVAKVESIAWDVAEVTGLSNGVVTITATTKNGVTNNIELTIGDGETPAPVEGNVTFEKSTYSCKKDDVIKTYVTSTHDITNYVSNNTEVATITDGANGKCSGTGCYEVNINCLTNGRATVSVKNSDNKEASAIVDVEEEKVSYTLTYNSNGGTACSPTSKTVYEGQKWGTLCKPTRKGYSFNGWFTSATGGTKVTDSTVASSDRTVYAQWRVLVNPKTGISTPTIGLIVLLLGSVATLIVLTKRSEKSAM